MSLRTACVFVFSAGFQVLVGGEKAHVVFSGGGQPSSNHSPAEVSLTDQNGECLSWPLFGLELRDTPTMTALSTRSLVARSGLSSPASGWFARTHSSNTRMLGVCRWEQRWKK